MPSYLSYKNFVYDAKDDEIESWITMNGNHIPIKKGQSKEEAVKEFIESKGGNTEKSTFKPTISEKEDPTFKQRTEILEKMKGVERGGKEYKSLSKEYMSLFPKKKPHIERERSPLNELVGAAMEPERARGTKESSSPTKATPKNTAVEKLNANGGDAIGKWKPISSGSHYYFRDENHWAQRQGEYYYVPENDNDFANYATMEGDTFGRAFVTVHIYKDGKAVKSERFDDGGDNKTNNMNNAIDYIVDYFKRNNQPADVGNSSHEGPEYSEEDILWEKAWQNVEEQERMNNLAPGGPDGVFYTDFLSPSEMSEYENEKEQKVKAEFERLKGEKKNGDGISGKYPEKLGIRQALWDAGYEMEASPDEDFGVTGSEYVWKDGVMYVVNITENSDGSAEAKMSSMGEVSHREYVDYIDEQNKEDEDDDDTDVESITNRQEALMWLNTQTRKHGNTYFWNGSQKAKLNKLIEKFGNTYFWNK